jgi:hypothetical protein
MPNERIRFKTEIPNVGAFAMFMDPNRIPVGTLEEKAP